MNRTDLIEFHTQFCRDAREIMRQKNNDYAGQHGESPFANFTRCEKVGLVSTEVGIAVRMNDKAQRIENVLTGTSLKVADETIIDTIQDYVNYLIILAAYLTEQREVHEDPSRAVVKDRYHDPRVERAFDQAVTSIGCASRQCTL